MNSKQKLILKRLVVVNGQKYSELFKFFSPDDKFPYHLKYLLSNGLITKREERYYLSKEGMKATADFDTRSLEEVKTPLLMFLFICQYKDKYLLRSHFDQDKNPKRQLYALPFAKPLLGQPLEESAADEFFRKYGLKAKFKYQCTYHQITRTSDNDILFDDLWLVFKTDLRQIPGEDVCRQNKQHWLTKEEMKKLPMHPAIERLIFKSNKKNFIEESVVLNYGIEKEDL